jgi:hypothetical protein
VEVKNLGHIANMAEVTNSFEILTERPERKRPLGRPRRRWNEKIRSYLHIKGGGREGMNCVHLAEETDKW